MAADSPNPYAPPTVEEPVAISQGRWRLDGNDLWVRNGAFFPGVDLVTGEVGLARTSPRRVVLLRQHGITWLLFAVVIVVLVGLPTLESRFQINLSPNWILIGALGALVFSRRSASPTRCLVRYEESRRRARRRGILGTCTLLCALGAAATPFLLWNAHTDTGLELMPEIYGVLLLLLLGFSIANRKMNGSLRAAGISGDWVLLGGVSPAAIAHIATLPEPETHPVDSDSRTYVIRMAKLPFLQWCHVVKWKPLSCLNVALGKLFQSPNFNTRGLLRLKPTETPAEAISEVYRARIAGLESDLAAGGWTFSGWDLLLVPDQFSTRVESATFVHRDRHDSLVLAEITGAFTTQFVTVLHAWLEDGTILRTSDERTFAILMNPTVEWERLPGAERSELISRHLQKSQARHAVILNGADDIARRLTQMGIENHAWLYGLRIYGALEQNLG